MIEKIFSAVVEMSVSASVVILAVCLVRLLLGSAPKVYSYGLWMLVLLRLVCPAFPEAGFSPMPEPVVSGQIAASILPEDAPVFTPEDDPALTTVAVDIQESNGSGMDAELPPYGEEVFTVKELLKLLWLAGIGVMAVYSLVSLFLLKRKLRVSIRLRDNIYLADYIQSPFVIGIVRPKIYLPSSIGESQAVHILLHEQHHIRRFDPAVKLLFFGALCLHWFNPLVWLAFCLMTQDMEMSCDEAVMKGMDGDVRLEYASSLLSLATPRRRFAAAPLAFGEGDPKRRIKNVLNYKKPGFWVTILAVAAIVIAAVCLLTDPKTPEEQNDPRPAQLELNGIPWNSSLAEVKNLLGVTDDMILLEAYYPPEGSELYSRYVLKTKGGTYFGGKAESLTFRFTDISGTGAYLGLASIEISYPDGTNGETTDMEAVREMLEKQYGSAVNDETYFRWFETDGHIEPVPVNDDPADHTWVPQARAGEYLTDGEVGLILQHYRDMWAGDAPEDQPDWDDLETAIRNYYLVKLVCPENAEDYTFSGSGGTKYGIYISADLLTQTLQFLQMRKAPAETVYAAGQLLVQNMALNWEPEDGSWHGLIVYDGETLQVGGNSALTVVESEIHDRQWLLQRLQEPMFYMDERDAKALLDACPGEKIELRRYYKKSEHETPAFTLVFFDGKLTWFAECDLLRVYEVERGSVGAVQSPVFQKADSPWQWSSELTVDDITSCQRSYFAPLGSPQRKAIYGDDLAELVELLNSLPESAFREGSVGDSDLSVTIQCGDREYVLHQGEGEVGLTFDSDTAALYPEGMWVIDSEELALWMSDFMWPRG